MGIAEITPVDLLTTIIREHSPEDIWQGSPLIGYRLLGNTNRGEIGEEFVRRYMQQHSITTGNGSRVSETDISIGQYYFEIKTASLGTNGTFQFNHVRKDHGYDYLLCIGICPGRVVFNMWDKQDVLDGKAGSLVEMAKAQGVTYKITKKLEAMLPVEELPRAIRAILSGGHNKPEE